MSMAAKANTAHDYLLNETVIEHDAAANHTRIYGGENNNGEHVVILPSFGRGVEDYTEDYNSTITTRLVEAGYRVVLIQPRGIGKSSGDLTPGNVSMSMLAQDIKAVLDALEIGRINLIGHAFGNRLARTFATLHPDYVARLVLMASGGNFALNGRQIECLTNSFNLALDDSERIEYIRCAFFAKGNDPAIWLNGWYPKLAEAQMSAAKTIKSDFFKKAGGKPFLLIQAAEDFIAPPDKAGKVLKAELGDQVTYVEIANAGHALSCEQPDAVANEIVKYFQR